MLDFRVEVPHTNGRTNAKTISDMIYGRCSFTLNEGAVGIGAVRRAVIRYFKVWAGGTLKKSPPSE